MGTPALCGRPSISRVSEPGPSGCTPVAWSLRAPGGDATTRVTWVPCRLGRRRRRAAGDVARVWRDARSPRVTSSARRRGRAVPLHSTPAELRPTGRLLPGQPEPPAGRRQSVWGGRGRGLRRLSFGWKTWLDNGSQQHRPRAGGRERPQLTLQKPPSLWPPALGLAARWPWDAGFLPVLGPLPWCQSHQVAGSG